MNIEEELVNIDHIFKKKFTVKNTIERSHWTDKMLTHNISQ